MRTRGGEQEREKGVSARINLSLVFNRVGPLNYYNNTLRKSEHTNHDQINTQRPPPLPSPATPKGRVLSRYMVSLTLGEDKVYSTLFHLSFTSILLQHSAETKAWKASPRDLSLPLLSLSPLLSSSSSSFLFSRPLILPLCFKKNAFRYSQQIPNMNMHTCTPTLTDMHTQRKCVHMQHAHVQKEKKHTHTSQRRWKDCARNGMAHERYVTAPTYISAGRFRTGTAATTNPNPLYLSPHAHKKNVTRLAPVREHPCSPRKNIRHDDETTVVPRD